MVIAMISIVMERFLRNKKKHFQLAVDLVSEHIIQFKKKTRYK